jgi:hypothetical protein
MESQAWTTIPDANYILNGLTLALLFFSLVWSAGLQKSFFVVDWEQTCRMPTDNLPVLHFTQETYPYLVLAICNFCDSQVVTRKLYFIA